jgi:hypothetical protein
MWPTILRLRLTKVFDIAVSALLAELRAGGGIS